MPHKADLVSSIFERWRFSDRPVPGLQSVRVFDQGDELTGGGVDYEVENDSVIALVSEAGEPLTVETVSTQEYIFRDFLGDVLARTALSAAAVDVRRLASIYANSASIFTRRAPAGDVLGGLLKGVGGYSALRRDGVLALDALVPPTSPGPRGGPCVEIASAGLPGDGSVVWETGADLLTDRSFTLGAWLKTHRFGPTDNTVFGDVMVMRVAGTLDELRFNIDLDDLTPVVEIEWFHNTVLAAQRRVAAPAAIGQLGGWYFVAAVNDESAGTLEFFGASEGDSELSFLGATADVPWENQYPIGGAGSLQDVNVGHDAGLEYELFRGGVAEVQVWDAALSFTAVENAFKDTLPNTTGRTFFASLDGLSAAALEDVESSTAPAVTGDVSERPNLVVDLTRTPRPFRRRDLVPAQRIEVRFAANDALTPEEIAPIVADPERLAAQQPYRVLAVPVLGAGDDHLDAKEIVISSPWSTIAGASATARLLRHNYAPGREFGILGPSPDAPLRGGLLLEAGDEVRVYDEEDLAAGLVYRVTGNQRSLSDLDCQLMLWR